MYLCFIAKVLCSKQDASVENFMKTDVHKPVYQDTGNCNL